MANPLNGGLKLKKYLIIAFIFLICLLNGCQSFQSNNITKNGIGSTPEYVFKLAEIHNPDYPTSLADENFASLVHEKTNGRIQIDVYTDGTLGTESEVIEQLQYGDIEFARVSIAPMAEFSDTLNALMMPFLYENPDHMWRVLNSSLGFTMLESISAAGMIGLAWYDSGSRSFYVRNKIDTLKDLEGKKIRVQTSSLMFAMCESLNIIPVTMAESEIYNGVKSGIIDGAENNLTTYESFSQYEVCNYFIVDEHTRIPEILAGSEVALSVLSKEDMKIIQDCAKETQEYEKELLEITEVDVRNRLEEKGVVFIELSSQEKEQYRKACETLYEDFGSDYRDVIEQIKGMSE
jgi:tripartite ATP-independent transporter DctP family solute receptor